MVWNLIRLIKVKIPAYSYFITIFNSTTYPGGHNIKIKNMTEFYFELSSNGEKTNFQEIEGVSTEVALRNNLKDGDNPFKFRLPNLPKGNKLVLKKGQAYVGSSLLQWADQANNQDNKLEKSKASLTLKNAKGKSLVEWTLFNAFPGQSKMAETEKKATVAEIENLELNFSFFTFSKK